MSFNKTILPSGLRIVTETMPGARSAAFGVYAGVGSRHESAELSGGSHFLEHLLFKGTHTRTSLEISSAMDEVGGEMNAFTAKDYTCFHARVLDEDLPLAIEIIGDMMTSSVITGADTEIERQVILDELAMHDDDPDDLVSSTHAAAVWPQHGLGAPVGGTARSVAELTTGDIEAFYRQHYVAHNLVIAAAGNLHHHEVVALVEKAFSANGFLSQANDPHPPTTKVFVPSIAATTTLTRSFEQANLMLSVDAFARDDARRFAMGVLVATLGGGPSSRLFQSAREKHALAYSVFAFTQAHPDAGLLCVGAGCLPERLEALLGVIDTELALMARDGITADELRRAQGQLRGGLVMGLEDSGSRMFRIGRNELADESYRDIDEVLVDIAAVTVDEVNQIAGELLASPQSLTVVSPGP